MVDLDSDELSESATFNGVHSECLSAYFDYLDFKASGKWKTGEEIDYPTEEMILLAKIFNESGEVFRRRTKAFERIMDGGVIFKYKRIENKYVN